MGLPEDWVEYFHTDRTPSLMCGEVPGLRPDLHGCDPGLITCSGVGVMGVSLGSRAEVGRGVVCWLESPRWLVSVPMEFCPDCVSELNTV